MTTHSKASDVEARERESFEEAYLAKNPHLRTNLILERYGDDYVQSFVRMQWEGWQLARASQQPSAQWIACSERMPEPHQKVVILLRGGLIFSGAYKAYYEKLPHEEGGPTYRYALTAEDFSSHTPVSSCATHWMPAESLRALLPRSPDTARTE